MPNRVYIFFKKISHCTVKKKLLNFLGIRNINYWPKIKLTYCSH